MRTRQLHAAQVEGLQALCAVWQPPGCRQGALPTGAGCEALAAACVVSHGTGPSTQPCPSPVGGLPLPGKAALRHDQPASARAPASSVQQQLRTTSWLAPRSRAARLLLMNMSGRVPAACLAVQRAMGAPQHAGTGTHSRAARGQAVLLACTLRGAVGTGNQGLPVILLEFRCITLALNELHVLGSVPACHLPSSAVQGRMSWPGGRGLHKSALLAKEGRHANSGHICLHIAACKLTGRPTAWHVRHIPWQM